MAGTNNRVFSARDDAVVLILFVRTWAVKNMSCGQEQMMANYGGKVKKRKWEYENEKHKR